MAKTLRVWPAGMAASQDLSPPQWGPAFLRLGSLPYRLEYTVATIAVFGIVFGWRLAILHDLDLEDTGLFIFWFLWPDLLAFLPIGVAMRGRTTWPRWGPTLYNVPHSLLTWAAVFLTWSALSGAVIWPLLGWAGHITMDRAVGYHLRAKTSGR